MGGEFEAGGGVGGGGRGLVIVSVWVTRPLCWLERIVGIYELEADTNKQSKAGNFGCISFNMLVGNHPVTCYAKSYLQIS